jgi:hypothetical protein
MNRTNLHAEQRVDSRGNVVTRWVKSFTQPKQTMVGPPAGMARSDLPTVASNANKVNNLKTQPTALYEQNKKLIGRAADKKDLDLLQVYQKNLKNYSAAELNLTVKALREMGYDRASLKIDDKYMSIGSGIIKAVMEMTPPKKVPSSEIVRVMTVAMDSMEDYDFIEQAIRKGQYPFQGVDENAYA